MVTHYTEFEWDEYNAGKNLIKHNVSDNEIEQVFENPYVIFKQKNTQIEKLYSAVRMAADICFYPFSIFPLIIVAPFMPGTLNLMK